MNVMVVLVVVHTAAACFEYDFIQIVLPRAMIGYGQRETELTADKHVRRRNCPRLPSQRTAIKTVST